MGFEMSQGDFELLGENRKGSHPEGATARSCLSPGGSQYRALV